jgi:adenylate kinase family enzyme
MGASGSGKTYLSKKLCKLTKFSLLNLDSIKREFSVNIEWGKKLSKAKRIKLYNSFVDKNKVWIIEGTSSPRKQYDSENSDLIIFLKKNWFVSMFNTFRRYFVDLLNGRNSGFFNFLRMVRYNCYEGWKRSRKRLEVLELKYAEKLRVFSSADEAYDWFCSEYFK